MKEFIATLSPEASDQLLAPRRGMMQRALIELARANTPAAFRLIVDVVNGSGCFLLHGHRSVLSGHREQTRQF